MSGTFAILLVSLDLLLVAALFWTVVLRRWRAAAGALIALTGSAPLLWLSLAGEFRWPALLVFLATMPGGGALLIAQLSAEWRGRP